MDVVDFFPDSCWLCEIAVVAAPSLPKSMMHDSVRLVIFHLQKEDGDMFSDE